jgi:hyperosmotically inducible periplasmic protein
MKVVPIVCAPVFPKNDRATNRIFGDRSTVRSTQMISSGMQLASCGDKPQQRFDIEAAMRHVTTVGTLILLISAGCSDATPTKVPSTSAPVSTAAKDNTGINERDRSAAAKTPIDQNENQKDIDVTANIRKHVIDRKLSVNAQNVKIITQDGKVTLRGPVKSADEKNQIEQIAGDVAGIRNVNSQLEIQP